MRLLQRPLTKGLTPVSDEKPPSPPESQSSSAAPPLPEPSLEQLFGSIASGLDGQNRLGAAAQKKLDALILESASTRSSQSRVEDRLSSQHDVLQALLEHARAEEKTDAEVVKALEDASQVLIESEKRFRESIDESDQHNREVIEKIKSLELRETEGDTISVSARGIRGNLRWITVITYGRLIAVPLAVKIAGVVAAAAAAVYAFGRSRGWWH